MTEMFKDDGMALIHAGSTSSLKSGILTRVDSRQKRESQCMIKIVMVSGLI